MSNIRDANNWRYFFLERSLERRTARPYRAVVYRATYQLLTMRLSLDYQTDPFSIQGRIQEFFPGGVRWDTVTPIRRRRLRGRYGGGFGGPPPKKILNMKCSRSDSEQTSGTLEIFSRAIFLGTFMGSNLSWRGVCGSRKLRNMKCSRSDFRHIEGTL